MGSAVVDREGGEAGEGMTEGVERRGGGSGEGEGTGERDLRNPLPSENPRRETRRPSRCADKPRRTLGPRSPSLSLLPPRKKREEEEEGEGERERVLSVSQFCFVEKKLPRN